MVRLAAAANAAVAATPVAWIATAALRIVRPMVPAAEAFPCLNEAALQEPHSRGRATQSDYRRRQQRPLTARSFPPRRSAYRLL